MILASISKTTICLQCGTDSGALNQGKSREFCTRCGSPLSGLHYDPLRTNTYGSRVLLIDSSAKLIVRFGVLGIGVVSLFTGMLLFYGGWFSPDNMDVVQIWVSRASGPMLLAQGLAYCWMPFRRPIGAKVLQFSRLNASKR